MYGLTAEWISIAELPATLDSCFIVVGSHEVTGKSSVKVENGQNGINAIFYSTYSYHTK